MIDLWSVHMHQSLVPLVPFNWTVGCMGRLVLIFGSFEERKQCLSGSVLGSTESPGTNLRSFLELFPSPLFHVAQEF